MAIDWSKEPFARLYKRETDDDLMLSWEALAVWHAFLKRCDHTGRVATKHGVIGLARFLRIPLEVIERVMQELIEDGRLRSEPPTGFIAPNYVDANYAARSNSARQAALRAKRMAAGTAEHDISGLEDCNDDNTEVTRGNAESRDVTRSNENCHIISTHIISDHQSPQANDAGASKSRSRTRAGIPEDWKPRPDEQQVARELGLDCEQEAKEFLSFWLGDGRPKKNWDQAFRNRLQSQARNGFGRRGGFTNQPAKPRKLEKL